MTATHAAALRRFVETIEGIVSHETATELFALFNRIALLRYEEAANSGFLLLCRPGLASDLAVLRLEAPFDVRDVRGVRKMLQISDHQLCVVCDGKAVYGFAAAESCSTGALLIQFHSHGVWELRRAGGEPVAIDARAEEPLRAGLNEEQFIACVEQVLGPLPRAELQQLWSLIATAQHQLRGTNVLISKHAAREAERLASQCTRVSPVQLTPALMGRLTSIDGTVIIDTRGVCYAIGAILDGEVSARGDRARGGRYNSALMYVDSCPFPCLIVVVSQDGMVDLVYRTQTAATE